MAFGIDIPLPTADAVDNTVIFTLLALEFFLFKIKQDNYRLKFVAGVIAFIGVLLISRVI